MRYSVGDVLLNVENVGLEYDGRPILKGVNAQVRDIVTDGEETGQIVAFLGPSGIGKTQLFRIIAGLKQPTSGSVTINGHEGTVKPGQVGVVAQNYPLFPHRTLLSNLGLAAMQKEKDPKVALEKVMALAADFDLTERLNLYPAQLSGGQRQRGAIIQQVLCSEHFLLMDEPFSGLDLIVLEKTQRLIEKVAHLHSANTVIVITHDITAACAIADKVWLMGRDNDPNEPGKKLSGARIVKEYDLAADGLYWYEDIITQPRFIEFVRMVKEDFRFL